MKKDKTEQGVYIFYSSCFIIKGFLFSQIYDIQRNESWVIDTLLADFFLNKSHFSTIELKKNLKDDTDFILSFLLENELIFFCKNPNKTYFEKINTEYECHWRGFNAIVDIGKKRKGQDTDIRNFFYGISKLGCDNLQIRSFSKFGIKRLESYLELTNELWIKQISYISPFHKDYEDINGLIEKNKRLKNLFFYNANVNKIVKKKNCTILYSSDNIDKKSCGIIEKENMGFDNTFFFKTCHYNNCLYKMISMDEYGNIKNCPAFAKSYGKIGEVKMENIIKLRSFHKMDLITKDKIDVCKDCELRFMCQDCRCFIKDPKNIYSHPQKCTYNPYIGKWKDDVGYVPIEECGTYSKEEGFIPNQQKINILNKT